MISGHKDGLSRDTVHVDTSAAFHVVEMDETVFGHQENDTVLL